MKNSSLVFVLSLFFTFVGKAHAQITVEPTFMVKYSDSANVHSRAITSYKKWIFIAASDGKLYQYNSRNNKAIVYHESNGIEYRDVLVTPSSRLVLASGDSSETIYSMRIIKNIVRNSFPSQFLDGIACANNTIFMMGDPIDGQFNLYSSSNLGMSWNKVENAPMAFEGEAGFAASGTNVRMLSETEWLFVSGGTHSRLFRTTDSGATWTENTMGFESCPSCGAYSFVILPNQTIVAVGGDYTKANEGQGTCRISNDNGVTWHEPTTNLNGYRSKVLYHKGILYACGTNGIDFSVDFGETWNSFATGNYFTMTIFKKKLMASTTNGTLHFFKLQK